MTRRLLGPIGGPIVFLLVAGLVFAGLGWVTVASLRVERAQQEAAVQAEIEHNLRVALWRLDGRLLPVFGVEDSRPFHHYVSSDATADYVPASAPLLAAELPDWMRLHFQLSHDIGWDSPQVLPSETVAGLREHWPGLPLVNVTQDRIALLGQLRAKYPPSHAIEFFAARERAIPPGSPPLAVPLFIDNTIPMAPAPPSPVGGREEGPGTSEINTLPVPAPPPAQQNAIESLQSEATGINGRRADPPAIVMDAEPAGRPWIPRLTQAGPEIPGAPENENLSRQNNRLSDKGRGGEYLQRSQSVSKGMEDAKKVFNFPNQNPYYGGYGGFGPLALNAAKPPGGGASGMGGGVRFGYAAPAPDPGGAMPGIAGGFGGAAPLSSVPPAPAQAGLAPPTVQGPTGNLAFARPLPPRSDSAKPTSPAEGITQDRFAHGGGPEATRSSVDGAAPTASGFGKAASPTTEPKDKRSLADEAGGARGGKPGGARDASRKKDSFYFEKQKAERGFFDSLGEAIRAKEAEEGSYRNGGTAALGAMPGRSELKKDLSLFPPPPLAAPGSGVPPIAGGPIASALLNPRPETEKALPERVTPDGLRLAPTGPAPAGSRPLSAPVPTEPAAGGTPRQPLPLTPDPAPPAVLEPVLPEPLVAGNSPRPALAVHLGSMRPQWLTAADGTDMLVLVRAARLEDRTIYQGIVLDWEKLQGVLKDEVDDLFPDAKLVAVKDPSGVSPERTMTALPVQLDPGPAPQPPPPGWTPLRFGLVLAWTAAIIAFAAVGLCGWSLIDLSERRIRFVSAVTHELRTPLTALRLYLDLLLSGMVQDEEKRREYLSTLNAESDRLHRLIDNVLDFARLERQRKGNAIETVKVADLLDQVRVTWSDRCGNDRKELVAVSLLPPEAMVSTDPVLVQQIIGNLIDNARKYTRDAEDGRIWVWAKPGVSNQVVFEVEDRGSGIPPRERTIIFRPFRRGESADTKAGGAGLGLALSKQWAELLGGRLTYRPADGGTGSCFRLELRAR